MSNNSNIHFGVTYGMRGYFAVQYDALEGPIQTGIGSYDCPDDAAIEAIEWAMSEGFENEAEKLRKQYFSAE